MKNTALIISIIALVAVIAFGAISLSAGKAQSKSSAEGTQAGTVSAEKGDIVYFNLDRVLNEYDMANELSSAVESKVQNLSQEVQRRGNKLQNDVNSFNEKVNKGLLTRSVAEAQSQQLQKQQDEFNAYAAQKQQEAAEEQQVMLNQIADAINDFIVRYNETMQYAMIISTQGDILASPVVTGDPGLDITDALIAGLNDEYLSSKSSKKAKAE